MKVLHIAYDVVPQSAPWRIHEAMLSNGIDSYIYVLGKSTPGQRVLYGMPQNFYNRAIRLICLNFWRVLEKGILTFFKSDTTVPLSLGIGSLLNRKFIKKFNPDVINLHWICGHFVSMDDILWLSQNYKVVWTLHDSWAFTGGCHVFQECTKWQTGCYDCRLMGKRLGIDLAKWVFKRKIRTICRANITMTGVSKWMTNCIKKSYLLNQKDVFLTHNTLNQQVFKPVDKYTLRNIFGLPKDKKLILFGARNSTKDKNKGYYLLLESLSYLLENKLISNFELVIFGSEQPSNVPEFGVPAHYMGSFCDNVSLSMLYGAADVMVVPSKQESFGQTVLEALSCGTPVVAFAIGGIIDQIDHMVNGFLATPYNSQELAQGIAYIIKDEDRWKQMSEAARNKAAKCFSEGCVTQSYLQAYQDMNDIGGESCG